MCSPMNRAKFLVNSLIIGGVAAVMLPLLLILGPIYEGRHFPVTSDVKVRLLRTEGDRMVFQAYGIKKRDCTLTDVKVLLDVNGNSKHTKGVIYVIDDGIGATNRPIGYQDLGIWGIHPVSKGIQVQTTYRCHFLWDTYQVLGAWPADDIDSTKLKGHL